MLLFLVWQLTLLSSAHGRGKASRGKKDMFVSLLEHGNVLPQYRFMCKESGGEFEESGYCKVAQGKGRNFSPQRPLNPPCRVSEDPNCPDFVFEGIWQDSRTQTLPYTVQDVYHRDQTPTTIDVLKLESDRLEATITPQWGGRLWGLTDKLTGKPFFYDSEYFQPTNDALRQAYIEGGSEWNFGTQIGHMSNTAEDVCAAKLETEYGDVIRVYTFERISGAVWQVDMLAGNGSVFWVHPKMINPGEEEIMGYWWTNVGINVDSNGTDAVRILTAAKHWVSDSTKAALPPWPRFHERQGLGLGSWTSTESSGDWVYPNYPDFEVPGHKFSATPIDHSYAFLWWEKRDVWFDLVNDPHKIRYNGWVDRHGGNMIHGHPNNGTKAWIWGTSPVEQFWQDFGGGPTQNNLYTELQVGVMPTQYQGFPMKAKGGTREWTEYFAAQDLSKDPDSLSKLHDPDYHGTAIPSVEHWLNSEGLGSDNSSLYDEINTFLTHLANRKPTPKEIMHSSAGWGTLEEMRTGKPLAPGALFLNDAKSLLANHDTKPWYELVSQGTFSATTLGSHPSSFQTTDGWMELLEESVAAHGGTWLHYLHIGIGMMNRVVTPGDTHFKAAAAMFRKSLALKVTPEAHRNLAIVAHANGDHNEAYQHYVDALKMATNSSDPEPQGQNWLVRDLSAESAYHFALLGMTNCTEVLTSTGADALVPPHARHTDRWRFAQVQAAHGSKRWNDFFELCDCSPTRLWPALGWWGGGTEVMLEWYQDAVLQRAAEKAGHPLSQIEHNAAIRANPVPFCLRAVGH